MSPPTTMPLRFARCAYHREREATALCRGCGQSFCRECVTEHAAAMYCGRCLSHERAQSAAPRGGWAAWARRGAACALALVLIVLLAMLTMRTIGSTSVQRLPAVVNPAHAR